MYISVTAVQNSIENPEKASTDMLKLTSDCNISLHIHLAYIFQPPPTSLTVTFTRLVKGQHLK